MGTDLQISDLRQTGVDLFGRWTALWNRELPPDQLMAPEFRLRYAQPGTEVFDQARHPEDLAAIVEKWHSFRPGLRFRAEGEAVVDLALIDGELTGKVARPYSATFADDAGRITTRSGIDMLAVTAGRITEVWSVSGGAAGRSFYPQASE